MNYREKLWELIRTKGENGVMQWISEQPLLDQPDIFKELKKMGEEAVKKNGGTGNITAEDFKAFDDQINLYQDKILDEKLAEAQLAMTLDEQKKVMDDIEETTKGVRNYVIECIVTNASNAEPMKELAQKMIALEKQNGLYDPKNWQSLNI